MAVCAEISIGSGAPVSAGDRPAVVLRDELAGSPEGWFGRGLESLRRALASFVPGHGRKYAINQHW
jgi:hypothetical protein